MVKRIGSFIFFITAFIYGVPQVQLKITDIQGVPIKETTLGVPCILEITQLGLSNDQEITVNGLGTFNVESRSTLRNTSIINGRKQSKTHYQYRIYSQKEGSFTIGPARMKDKRGRVIFSNTVSLAVLEHTQLMKDNEAIFLRLTSNKKRVVVGEKILLMLRFYVYETQIDNVQVIPPKMHAIAKEFSGPIRGLEEIDGKTYQYAQWHIEVFSEESGKLLIPAAQATYTIPERMNNFFNTFFNQFGAERKEVYSNSIRIDVDPLPPYHEEVNGIGHFQNLTVHLEQSSAVQGEGVVVKLIVEGNGNIEMVTAPRLTLPKGLKYYDSKNEIQKGMQGTYKKSFEYIVQAMDTGNFEIPSQKFVFFDTDKYAYKILYSNPLSLSITEQAVVQFAGNSNEHIEASGQGDTSDDDILPINTQGPWYDKPERLIPFKLFILLIIVPLCFFILFCAWLLRQHYYRKNAVHFIKKNAFNQARKKILLHKKEGNLQGLYKVFVQLFVERFGLISTDLSAEKVHQILVQAGFNADNLTQWDRFFSQLTEYRFFNKFADMVQLNSLITRASAWIDQLEEKL